MTEAKRQGAQDGSPMRPYAGPPVKAHSRTAEINCARNHYNGFPRDYQGGDFMVCVAFGGVGDYGPCAAFVVSRERLRGTGKKQYHPQRLVPLRLYAVNRTAEGEAHEKDVYSTSGFVVTVGTSNCL